MSDSEAREGPNWVRFLAAVGSPIAIATALLFYFGWVRTRSQSRALGYDPSVLDLSVQDYLLKSINVLFLPMVLIVLAGLALHHQHRRLAGAHRNPRIAAGAARTGRLLVRSWPIWLVFTLVLLTIPLTKPLAMPAGLTLGLLAALYGNILLREFDGGTRWSTTTTAIVSVLLAFAIFWDTERIARTTGDLFAQDILAVPQQLVSVTIYSQKSLELSAPGITGTRLGSDSAYTFRYTGLRLLESTSSHYLLMNEAGGYAIMVRDSDNVRFEFQRPTEG